MPKSDYPEKKHTTHYKPPQKLQGFESAFKIILQIFGKS